MAFIEGKTNAGDLVRTIMKKEKFSVNWLARELGYKSQSGVSSLLTGKRNITIGNLVAICNLIGYDVIIKPKHRGNHQADEYVVRPEE